MAILYGNTEKSGVAIGYEHSNKGAKTMATENTTSQILFSHLFEACNILRGPINQDEYKSYVTPILFFKRLSDVYDDSLCTGILYLVINSFRSN